MNNITKWLLRLTDEEAHRVFEINEKGCAACPADKWCECDGKTSCAESIQDWGQAEASSPTVSEVTHDAVNHPAHYNTGSIEAIDAIDDWGLNFELGNVVEYVAQAGHNGKALEDLKKAQRYLNHEIERRTANGDTE